jgi:hypothetical protein
MTTNQQVIQSEWAPLQIAAFRAIWFASPFGKCRDVVPKCGGCVAHDEIHSVSPLDCSDADGDDAACFSLKFAGVAVQYCSCTAISVIHPRPDSRARSMA